MTFSVALGESRPQTRRPPSGGPLRELTHSLSRFTWVTPPAGAGVGVSDGARDSARDGARDTAAPAVASPGHAREWLGPLEQALAQGRFRIVKRGPHRTVYRVDSPGMPGAVYVKHFHPRGWFNWLKHLVRPTRAQHEAQVAALLDQHRLPVPRVLAWGVTRRLGSPCESVLVTHEVPRALPLDEWPMQLARVAPAQQATARQQLAVALGELLGRLQGLGVRHGDLHAGNVLVSEPREGPVRLTLIDLQSIQVVARPVSPSDPRVPEAVTAPGSESGSPLEDQQGGWFRKGLSRWLGWCTTALRGGARGRAPGALHLALTGWTTATDRLRFWRAFERTVSPSARVGRSFAGNHAQLGVGGERGTGPRSPRNRLHQRQWLAEVLDDLTIQTLQGWQRADRAFARGNRHVRRIASHGRVLRGLATLPENWLRDLVADPERLFDPGNRLETCKQTHRCRVVLARAPELPAVDAVCVKGVIPGRMTARWLQRFRWSPVRRAWELGQALLRRGLDTPRPLACIDSAGQTPGMGYLVTEALTGTQTARALVAERAATADGARTLWPLARRLARQLRRLHACQFDHRDLKLANLLVQVERSGPPWDDLTPAVAHPAGSGTVTGSEAREEESGHRNPGQAPRRLRDRSEPRIWLLDLEGIRRWRRLPRARRVQNLARLHVSVAAQGMHSRALRARFLRAYLAGSGEDWRIWWNWIAIAARRKQNQNDRRGRPIS